MLAAGQAVAQPRGDQADDGRLQGHGVVVAGEPVQVYPLLGHLAPARRVVAALAERATQGQVTLVYGARDTLHNEAVVLCAVVIAARAGVPDPHMAQ